MPTKYYLKRWSRESTNEVVFDSCGDLIRKDRDPFATECYSELSHISQRIISKCCSKSKELFPVTKSLMLKVEHEIEEHIRLMEEQESVVQKSTSNTNSNLVPDVTEEVVLRDPQKRDSRGQSSKRLKSSVEIPSKSSARKGGKANEVIPTTEMGASSIHQPIQMAYPQVAHPPQVSSDPIYKILLAQQRTLPQHDYLLTPQAACFQNAMVVGAHSSRYNGGTEIFTAPKKPRICRTCKIAGHDTRNCKKRKQEGVQNKADNS